MNCQKKTYQFNNATLSLRQVIGQVFVLCYIIVMKVKAIVLDGYLDQLYQDFLFIFAYLWLFLSNGSLHHLF